MNGCRLMLAGDIMLGRGLDQILPHPGDPRLYEPYVASALDYVALAEAQNGPIPRPAGFDYPWGEAPALLAERRPDCRIVNLETAVTRSGTPDPKGINYRMTPENLPALTALGVDCCVLANNHLLDWGEAGLETTLRALDGVGLGHAGAGRDAAEAAAPAVLPAGDGTRVLVYAAALSTSGVPADWAAAPGRPGVAFLPNLSEATATTLGERIEGERQDGDRVVLSLHWGPNWGYAIDPAERRFAHTVIEAGVDVVFGHSSHHAKAVEVHRGRPVFYGLGDFLNDYEGIGGHEAYRADLVLMALVDLGPDSALERLELVPFRIRRFRLERATGEAADWLERRMDEECSRFGGRVRATDDGMLVLDWR